MSGRRILDAVALLRVGRNVAYNHFAIRYQQAQVFGQTSSLTKAFAKRYPAAYSLAAHRFSQSSFNAKEQGIEQDHHFERSNNNGENGLSEEPGISVTQRKAQRHPLPDGTIPPVDSPIGAESGDAETVNRRADVTSQAPLQLDNGLNPTSTRRSSIPIPDDNGRDILAAAERAKKAQRASEAQIPTASAEPPESDNDFAVEQDKDLFYQPPGTTKPVLSALPRVKVPKVENDVQGVDENVPAAKDINADVFYTSTETNENEPTEEQLKSLFHGRRASQLLGKKEKYMPGNKRSFHTTARQQDEKQELKSLAQDVAKDVEEKPFQMRESRVPSSRMGRLFEYGGLAASMAFGAASSGSMLSPANMERLVAKLSKMRGAALKLGQMISFQDIKMLPPAIVEVLQRVQDSADYMPASQRDRVIADALGNGWKSKFQSFEDKPIAAASIGQVHNAVLKDGQRVAVKVQYPGVADSISSDLNNLSLLLHATKLLPKGLYLDKTIANARTELAWECDYVREAESAKRFKELLADDTDVFTVPQIYDDASGKQVLTMEKMEGVAVTKIKSFTQEQRDWIGSQILRLCLREIIEFKFMQTDPNWTNFLYNSNTNKLELLDFGASREYPAKFVELYTGVLQAASVRDRKECERLSIELGYLTGYESKTMVNAHIDSVMTLAEPFMDFADDIYDFQDQTITDRVRGFIPVMLRERLAPPPEETYSLHRKMSGAFLLCARLGSRVRCKELFQQALEKRAKK